MRFSKYLTVLVALPLGMAHAVAFGSVDGDSSKVSVVGGVRHTSLAQVDSTSKIGAAQSATDLYAQGASRQRMGRAMSWGGIGVMVLAGVARQPVLTLGGFLAMMAGIPVNGSGASDMVDGVNQMNDRVKIDMTGWGTYIASWGTIAGGTVLAFSSQGSEQSKVIASILLSGGSALQFVAWEQFSNSADQAKVARRFSPVALTVRPAVFGNDRGGVVPGVSLAMRF
ncbi:MAG: hypothetical protein RL318_170 [Fibrobacterota bacterium]|jgi:hypothetical protein